jgi:molybdopterin/thiamine biosynthesis adenylyltransferase
VSSSRRDLFRAAAAAARDAAAAGRQAAAAPEPALPAAELERYSRQLVLPEWGETEQLRLRDASVLVVGAGALGSPVATYLAGAGVGHVGILDGDDVELSNLPRQHLHYTPDVGAPKVVSAAAKLRFLNPDVQIDEYNVRLDADNAGGLVAVHDLVVDCSDSFETRYAVNAACCAAGIPLVEGGVVGWSGLVLAIRPRESACYRCVFPTAPPAGSAPSCAEAGVLGPSAGVVGSLQALEALKLLAGLPSVLTDTLLQVDLADAAVTRVRVQRRLDCDDCGG